MWIRRAHFSTIQLLIISNTRQVRVSNYQTKNYIRKKFKSTIFYFTIIINSFKDLQGAYFRIVAYLDSINTEILCFDSCCSCGNVPKSVHGKIVLQ